MQMKNRNPEIDMLKISISKIKEPIARKMGTVVSLFTGDVNSERSLDFVRTKEATTAKGSINKGKKTFRVPWTSRNSSVFFE